MFKFCHDFTVICCLIFLNSMYVKHRNIRQGNEIRILCLDADNGGELLYVKKYLRTKITNEIQESNIVYSTSIYVFIITKRHNDIE